MGFAAQGELFLLSLAGIILLTFLFQKKKPSRVIYYSIGGVIGTLPLVISELRFNFRGAEIFFTKILRPSMGEGLGRIIEAYSEHVGLTMMQVVGGPNMTIAYLLLFGFFVSAYLVISKDFKSESRRFMIFTYAILISHLSLFFFSFVNAAFLDMELSLLFILFTTLIMFGMFRYRRFVGIIAVVVITLLQVVNYHKYILGNRPLDNFGFIQQPSTLAHKEDILDVIYTYADGNDFSFASIGTPYGVRTVWSSIFELYSQSNGVRIPKWYGYHANGFPGEGIMEIAEKPYELHVLLIESNINQLLAQPIIDQEISNQNTHTKVVEEVNLYDTTIQFRESIDQ
jgi:hypothetical protein